MAIRTYKVTLDSKNAIAPEPVFLRQGDKTGAVVIDATLMDNGAPVSLDGLTPMFKANTADGQAVIADSTGFSILDSANGEFTYQVPNALSAVPGKITTAYFCFSDSSGSESTFDVAFVIKKAVDITQAQADDYITIVDGTLKTLQQKIDAMNTDVQTILNAYNQGNFYNQAQTDSKDAATLASAKSYSDVGDAALGADRDTLLSAYNNSNVIFKDVTANFTLNPPTILVGAVSVCQIPSMHSGHGIIFFNGTFNFANTAGLPPHTTYTLGALDSSEVPLPTSDTTITPRVTVDSNGNPLLVYLSPSNGQLSVHSYATGVNPNTNIYVTGVYAY